MNRATIAALRGWTLIVFALLSFAFCQSALAGGRPSHETALTQIREHIPDTFAFTVTNLKYVNGYSLDASRYVVVVTFRLHMKISSDPGKSKNNFHSDIQSANNAFNEIVLWVALGHYEPVDSFDMAEEWIFLDTEKGWILQGPKAAAQVVARHTPNADAVDRQDEEEKKAQQEANRQGAQEFYRKQRERIEAIRQACAAGQQMHVLSGPLHPEDMQGGGTLDQWVYQGQAVTPIPGDNRPFKCHAQYTTSRGHTISGYIDFSQLTLN